MREIVTIQAGEFANYIGSHFWNFQDELLGLNEDPNSDPIFKNTKMDMDVLYRTGQTHQGVWTYCPRVLSIGSQGSLGTLSSSGSLYGNVSKSDQPDVLTWKGGITKSIEKPREKNLFLQNLSQEASSSSNPNPNSNSNSSSNSNSNSKIEDKEMVESLEKDVKYWSDFSKAQFHPKSLYELNGNWTDLQNFNNFGAGKEIISEGNHLEEINERLRFFVEECDHIQGIKYIVDDSGGFSAVSSAFLENIADDYANIPVLLYSAKDPNSYDDSRTDIKKLIAKSLHDSVSLAKLAGFCDLMVPIGIPSLNEFAPSLLIKDSNLFHSSAVYASALHSLSVPFRLGPKFDANFAFGSLDFREFVNLLTGRERQNKVAALDVSMPAGCLNDIRNILSGFRALTPEIGDDSDDLYASEALIFNGAFYSGQNRASISQVNETLTLKNPKSSHLSISLSPLPIPLPFPSIFSPQTGRLGETLISPQTLKKGPLEVESVPIATRIRSSIAIKPFLDNRKNNIFKYGIVRGAKGLGFLKDWGFGKEEVDEMGENLAKMVRVFDSEFSAGDESDESD
ncbi:hypothetical protein LUZ60_004972 [Juncus effusus]|nr:hypothetical protein LUZ60_004972 [Juncus effusus]